MAIDIPHTIVKNKFATAVIVHQGAHVLEYEPHGQEPLLWHSAKSHFALGKPIRGGIPVCWPWFGDHPVNPSKPAHGFVRAAPWQLVSQETDDDGATLVRLEWADDEMTRALWPHRFACEMAIHIGPQLNVTLTHRNTDAEAVTCTGALHSYFAVSDVRNISIDGLDGIAYFDKVDGMKRKTQSGPITITSETDRVYMDTAGDVTVMDQTWGRRLRIAKAGSNSTVVWNPWIAKAAKMSDFGDDEWPQMLCVEAANALDDAATIAPGQSHSLSTTLSIEAI